MKRCSTCGETKPLTEFQKNRKRPDGLQERCKVCRRAHYYKPEQWQQKRAYDAARRVDLAEQISEQRKEKYRSDPEYRERKKQNARDQKFKPGYYDRERKRHYKRWADPEYRKMRVAKFRERRHRDPEYRVKCAHWRRARHNRILAQGKPFTHAEWIALCERYDYRCLRCGERKPLTVDHVVPVSRGGSGGIENIQPLCADCNKRKHARTIDYRY